MSDRDLLIAILAKDKAPHLPLYLACLEMQTWPKSRTHIYIRTNDNKDDTETILREWVERVKPQYASIEFDFSSIDPEIKKYGNHEWNTHRFSVLGAIRQKSITRAIDRGCDYFVADCDNYLYEEETIASLVETKLDVVAPLIVRENHPYANYHSAVDDRGYFKMDDSYHDYRDRKKTGIFPVPVVHCTYLIRHEVLKEVVYDDGSGNYEYVVFSNTLRKKNIPQYLDTRRFWGYLNMLETTEDLLKEQGYLKVLMKAINKNPHVNFLGPAAWVTNW